MTFDATTVQQRIDVFKLDLANRSVSEIVRRHIVFGECAAISPEKYFQLRTLVASTFGVHPNDVLIVGSAKLGFSIKPKKRYELFSESSDLDVVIISEKFFDLIWQDLHRYHETGGYWERFDEFCSYLFEGWIRPDMLPPDSQFVFAKDWWKFFNHISRSRAFSVSRVRGAIYKNWYFLESFQSQAVTLCAKVGS
jgi:predicted nucleotidyltransferase